MQEKKEEMATTKTPKKTNLLDHNSIKHMLDESVTEIVTSKGFPEDNRMSNIRLLIGVVIIVIALFAQFYNKKFPENRNFLLGCTGLYPFRGHVSGFYLVISIEYMLKNSTNSKKKNLINILTQYVRSPSS
ncbi:hypothetical protein ACP275_06G135700 [Erythranthe tilingii]